MQRTIRWSRLALMISAVIWASHNIAGAWLTVDLNPYFANLLRTSLASFFYLPIMLHYATSIKINPSHLPRLIIAAFCLTGIFFLLFYVALSLTTANHVAIVLAAGPAVTALLARPYLKEPLSTNEGVGLILALAGAILVGALNRGEEGATTTWLGAGCAALAMIGFSHYTLLSKPLLKIYPLPMLLGICIWIGTILLWFAAPFVPGAFSLQALTSVSGSQWLAFVYIGLVMNLGSYLLYNYALQRLPAGVVHATTVYATTVFALLFAWWFLGETITVFHWLCVGLIAIGLWLTASSKEASVPSASTSR